MPTHSPDPLARPAPDLSRTVEVLARHGVRWVLAGSYVLAAHGARLQPGDLDVVPALDDPNLKAVAAALEALAAVPSHHPDWAECPPLEWHAAWRPRPATVENLDHLFVTAIGLLDIVPRLCGTYDELRGDARSVDVRGHEVLVAHPSTVLARLDGHRPKDRARWNEVQSLREEVDAGRAPEPVLPLPQEWRTDG